MLYIVRIFIHIFCVIRSVQDTKLTGQDTCLCDDPTKSWRLFVHQGGIFGNDGRNQNILVAALSAFKIVQWVFKLVALFWNTQYLSSIHVKYDGRWLLLYIVRILVHIFVLLGLFKILKSRVRIPVYVMIRPRAGDFLYTEEEFSVMMEEIKIFHENGADGFVFGLLTRFVKLTTSSSTILFNL